MAQQGLQSRPRMQGQQNDSTEEASLSPGMHVAQGEQQTALAALQEIHRVIRRLENRQTNLDINVVNRVLFSESLGAKLQPLVNIQTGHPIANLPSVVFDLKDLDEAAIDGILLELDIAVPGASFEAKKLIIERKWML